MFTIPGSRVQVPGQAIDSRPTQYPEAWCSHPITSELHSPFAAIRVHWYNLNVIGDWFAIGDIAESYEVYRARHALPRGFRYTGFFTLHPGTILNVGQCSPLFGLSGGGYQAEFLEGRFPQLLVQPTNRMNVAARP
jgi:hypothetical protein